jgi:hypothetical protein
MRLARLIAPLAVCACLALSHARGAPIVDQWSLVPEKAPWSSIGTATHQALAQTLLTGTTGVLSTVGLQLWHLDDAASTRGEITVEVRQMRKGNNPAGDLVASGKLVDTGFIPNAQSKGSEPLPIPLTLIDISESRYLTIYGERLSIVVKSTGNYAWKTVDEATAAGGGNFYARGNPYSRSLSVWSQGVADFGFATFVDPVQPGDVNLDGDVNLEDFGVIKQNFGQGARHTGGDLTGDGMVGLGDFGVLKANFGKSNAAAAAVPEPTSYFGWAAVCFAFLVCRSSRRRQGA